jgi:hypothetical protein
MDLLQVAGHNLDLSYAGPSLPLWSIYSDVKQETYHTMRRSAFLASLRKPIIQ